MKTIDFDVFKNLLYAKSGLAITTDKSYLLESRLAPVIRKWNIGTMDALTNKLRNAPDKQLVEEVVDAMTTNETMFFRDQKPFDTFRDKIVPEIIKSKGPGCTIRIWSAACSSGQEPYTLAMIIRENAERWSGVKFEIVATDLANSALAEAQAGKYAQFEVQRGVPIRLLVKYFTQSGENWIIKDEIRQMVTFKNFNLLDPADAFGSFDLIFCRNVLKYFDQPTKAKILERLTKRLDKYGYLFLGSTETILGVSNAFKPLDGQRGIYIPTRA